MDRYPVRDTLKMANSSSSSLDYCASPSCIGVACVHFSSWIVNGVHSFHTDNGVLYLRFNNFGSVQQVEVYRDVSYFQLLALGQGTVGSISLTERNSSGISGSVIWDGVPVSFSTVGRLNCIDVSSSSSSSIDSSSTSSTSSESTGCCTSPICHGASCAYLYSWSFAGLSNKNSNSCRVYVGLEYGSGNQQVRVYSNSTFTKLVAIGQRSTSGTIFLVPVSGSGLSGTVYWDGTIVPYENTLILDCNESSSSSSSSIDSSSSSSILSTTSSSSSSSTSSSSSIDSSSSSSSSSESSWQYSSSSSTSSSSNSSSSSIDSSSSSSSSTSSSSSESIGNVSSSSSSSLEIWNQSKPLILANSAISNVVLNRLSQAILLYNTTYEIGKIYVYLYSSNYGHAFNIHLSVCNCNDDGSPTTTISTQILDVSTVTNDGWYAFEFNIAGATPANRLLSFVMWQDGGNEDNYLLWGYSVAAAETYAWFSDDNIAWFNQKGVVRSLKIVGIFDMFDLDNYQVNSPEAEVRELLVAMNSNTSSTYNTTYLPEPSRIELDQPDLIVSFVVDSSGSMGWSDRFSNRTEFIGSFINTFVDYYPSNVLFDIVKFGALIADAQSITANMGQVMSINLDLNTPNRATYVFTTQSPIFRAYKGDTYTHNGFTYTPVKDYNGVDTVAMIGDGIPLSTGTLERTGGTGDASIVFGSFRAVNTSNTYFVATGFKKLSSGHTYNIAGIYIDDLALSTFNLNSWQLLYPSTESPSIVLASNGPKSSQSIDVIATSNLNIRTPMGSIYSNANVVSSVSEGDTVVRVSNVTPFTIGNRIDLLDNSYLSSNLIIESKNNDEITFSPSSLFNIGSQNISGGLIQQSSFLNKFLFTGTTVRIFLRDVNVGESEYITFYFQSADGYTVEWDIKAFDQWYIHNLYWMGETAILPISVFDKNGQPFPDGTRVDLEVDNRVEIVSQTKVVSQGLSEDALIGDAKVYVTSNEGFTRNQSVTLTDRIGNIQMFTIDSVGVEGDGRYYIQFVSPFLAYDFLVDNGAVLTPNDNPSVEAGSSPVPISLPMVDVTPIFTGVALNPLLREPYDPDPIPPSESYESINNVVAYTQEGSFNVPTINGNAAIRILPITEDVLKTIDDKAKEAATLLRMEPTQDFVGQDEQTTGDLDSLNIASEPTTDVEGKDYTIETPVYLLGGETESSMTTTSINLTKTSFSGLKIPGIDDSTPVDLFVKEYNVYPSITQMTKTNVIVSKQYFDPFPVDFTPPYTVVSIPYSESTVPFWVPDYSDDCGEFQGYKQVSMPGVFAGDENGSYTINYVVTNKLRLLQSGTLNIHLYSNRIANQESLASGDLGNTETSSFLNIKYADIVTSSNGTTVTTPHLSDIDQWRTFVENNPLGTLTEEADDPTLDSGGIFDTVRLDVAEALGGVSSGSSSGTPKSFYYTNPNEWTNATQYDEYEFTLNIVNGRASFTLPSNSTPSVIFVEASISFANNLFEAIRGDIITVANPIVVGPFQPNRMYPQDGLTFELASNITWMDGSVVIDDGVPSDIKPASTHLSPTASVTDDGYIRGLIIGPHAPYVYVIDPRVECQKTQLLENLVVKVDHPSGFSTTVTRIISWEGKPGENEDSEFYFKVPDGGGAWADGDGSIAPITSDLNWEENILWIGEDGIQRLLGLEQTNGRRWVFGSTDKYPLIPRSKRWGDDGDGLVIFQVPPINKNIGISTGFDVYMSTGYTGPTRFFVGTGVVSFPTPDADGGLVITRPKAFYNEPLGIEIELEAYDNTFIRDGVNSPNIVASLTWRGKSITKRFVRTDLPTNIVIDYPLPSVTFVSGVCTKTNTTEGDDPVALDSRGPKGCCLVIKSNASATLSSYVVESGLIRTDVYTDSGNSHTHSCFVDDKGIDTSGTGYTTGTIVLAGSFADHSHTIAWDSTLETYATNDDPPLGHTHTVRCVAITKLNPTTNTGLALTVNGYVVYDPTVATPHDLGLTPYYFPSLPEGNRIMFNSLKILGYTPSQPTLTLFLETGRDLHLNYSERATIPEASDSVSPSLPSYFTAETPIQTSRGFDIRGLAKFSEYTYEDYPGHSVTIPERIVDDGSRVTYEVVPYKPEGKKGQAVSGGQSGWDDSNVNIVAPDLVKRYMVLKFRASIASEGQTASREFFLMINSNLQWLSGISSLMPELSNDSSYITTALAQIDSIGGSQLHDAVKEATQRIIQEQTDTPSYKSYEKVIVLVTDGDENSSENSLTQAINGIHFIDGTGKTPALGIQLGKSSLSDEIIMKKYAENTNGNVYPVVNFNSSEINDLIDYVIETSAFGFNYGTFSNILTFEQPSILIDFRLGYVYLPTGSNLTYRTRYTVDGEQWSPWSEWVSYDVITTFSESDPEILSYQYEVRFNGNSHFESPILYGTSSSFSGATLSGGGALPNPIADGDTTTLGATSGPTATYNKPQSFTVFFKPISISTTTEEYLSSIHITHEAEIPETSEITYGLVQSGDLNIEEYLAEGKYIKPDTYSILLTRYNEILTTDNFKTYYALNGRWPNSCSIEIYKFNSQNPNGILVNQSEYAANSINGQINFFNYQNTSDTFSINVIFKPFFRLIAKITNHGQETAVIHHIGVIYNTCKRVPTDSNGNIIHKPISKRLSS